MFKLNRWFVLFLLIGSVIFFISCEKEVVNEIITSPPARRVNSRSMSSNLTCRFPSRKMGFTVQAESRSMELASIYIKEFDSAVMGYWDQPYHRPNLSYKSGSKNVRVPVTLDFFVISDGFIGFDDFYRIMKKRIVDNE